MDLLPVCFVTLIANFLRNKYDEAFLGISFPVVQLLFTNFAFFHTSNKIPIFSINKIGLKLKFFSIGSDQLQVLQHFSALSNLNDEMCQ